MQNGDLYGRRFVFHIQKQKYCSTPVDILSYFGQIISAPTNSVCIVYLFDAIGADIIRPRDSVCIVYLFDAVGATPCGRPLPCDCPLVLNSFPHLCTVGAAVCIRPHEISHIFMYYFRMGTYFAIYRVVARCHAVARCVFHIQIYFTF